MDDNNTKQSARERLSLWQWIRQNDILILIIVGLITVACTRVAQHIDTHHIQPHTNKLLKIQEGQKPNTWKVFVQFFIILFIIYILVEFVIQPQAPVSFYLLPDAVTEIKGSGNNNTTASLSNPLQSVSNPNPRLLRQWGESFGTHSTNDDLMMTDGWFL